MIDQNGSEASSEIRLRKKTESIEQIGERIVVTEVIANFTELESGAKQFAQDMINRLLVVAEHLKRAESRNEEED